MAANQYLNKRQIFVSQTEKEKEGRLNDAHNRATIYLHHPRSNMEFAFIQARTPCTNLCATEENCILADFDIHSIKLVRAADRLSSLTALPTPTRQYTPFLTCALAIGVMIHTRVSLIIAQEDRDE